MKYYNWKLEIGVMFIILICETPIKAQTTSKEVQINASEVSLVNLIDTGDVLTLKEELIDSSLINRRIIYRDLSRIESFSTVSGTIGVKVCINRAGLVTYVELYPYETSITDKKTLKKYLKAVYNGYKFQPDLAAPKEQCGKLLFNINNSSKKKV